MFLARVTKKVVSSEKHSSYRGRILYVVQPVLPDGTEDGKDRIAMDYLGANIGDIVVCGGAPGIAKKIFNMELAPIRTLIIAVVDKMDYRDI
jgi:ethanolamine utilization protein EutN